MLSQVPRRNQLIGVQATLVRSVCLSLCGEAVGLNLTDRAFWLLQVLKALRQHVRLEDGESSGQERRLQGGHTVCSLPVTPSHFWQPLPMFGGPIKRSCK